MDMDGDSEPRIVLFNSELLYIKVKCSCGVGMAGNGGSAEQ